MSIGLFKCLSPPTVPITCRRSCKSLCDPAPGPLLSFISHSLFLTPTVLNHRVSSGAPAPEPLSLAQAVPSLVFLPSPLLFPPGCQIALHPSKVTVSRRPALECLLLYLWVKLLRARNDFASFRASRCYFTISANILLANVTSYFQKLLKRSPCFLNLKGYESRFSS